MAQHDDRGLGQAEVGCRQDATMASNQPVSYTHLDVYKRQALDRFSPPRDPRILSRPTREFAHLYMWIGCQWVHVVPQADAPGV